MIHYQLQCGDAHAFDGWFRDSAAFDDQARRGLLECPVCGERNVTRAMMAPALARKGRGKLRTETVVEAAAPEAASPPASPPSPQPGQMAVSGEQMPAQLRAALQRMRREIERTSEYVGPAFATEARRIHEGESEARSIYGEATPEEAEALADDGVAVSRIPWLPRADS
jgi:hypothetical protein